MHLHLSVLRTTTSAALLATTFLACGGGGDDTSEAFVVRTSDFAAGATTPFAADGYQFAFLANEATSGAQDLNNDGDTLDDVAVFVDARTRVEKSTGIAARAVALLGDEPYLVAVEAADGVDWNKDGDELDSVLVRWDGLPRVATDIGTLPSGSVRRSLVVCRRGHGSVDGVRFALHRRAEPEGGRRGGSCPESGVS